MKILVVALVLLFAGCHKEGTGIPVQGAKDEFEVELLFEVDGVKVYRFTDGGNTHYFTTRGETMTMQREGKQRWRENIDSEIEIK